MFKENNPQFTSHNTPLTDDQLRDRERWMMEVGNWREDHLSPSAGEHYRYLWKWDETKGDVINARRGDPDRASTGLKTLLKYIDTSTGFNPNKIFATATNKTWRDYPEAWNFNDNTVGSSYTQPPLEAWAAIETYQSYVQSGREQEGLDFLNDIYGTAETGNYTGLKGGYAYFINHRQNSPDDPLVGIVHPNETGRDSDEANKPWLAYSDKNSYDAKLEWLKMQKFGWDIGQLGRDSQKKRVDWIPEQVREKYWVNDVMFNSLYAQNLRYLSNIADILYKSTNDTKQQELYETDKEFYSVTANTVEEQILNRMWDPEHGFFYNLDKDSESKIPVDSATGLFPLILENIELEQITALTDKLEDPNWFGTQFPIPTHAVRSKFYDPEPSWFKNKFTPQWSGTVWANVNMIIGEALAERAESFSDIKNENYNPDLTVRLIGNAGIIASKTHEMLAINPKSMEYYSPI
ncbi:MAG: hypothetical protein WAW80_01150, partial [Candidatus Saccharimonadales bacterium]